MTIIPVPKTRVYKDLNLDFLPHPDTGDISMWYDVNAVKQSLKNLMLTRYFERPFQPLLGSPLEQLLFEPLDPITAASMQQALERLIQNFEPRVQIQSIDIRPDYINDAYSVHLNFTIVGIQDMVSFSTTLKRLR